MLITVKVSAGAKSESIEEVSPNIFKIKVRVAREKGKANERVVEILAEYFNVAASRVLLKSGATSREKRFEIL